MRSFEVKSLLLFLAHYVFLVHLATNPRFLQELTKAQAEAAAKAAAANEGASAESADSSQGAAGSGPQTPAKTKKEQ